MLQIKAASKTVFSHPSSDLAIDGEVRLAVFMLNSTVRLKLAFQETLGMTLVFLLCTDHPQMTRVSS